MSEPSEPEGGNSQTPSLSDNISEITIEPNEPELEDDVTVPENDGETLFQATKWIMVWNNYDTRERAMRDKDVFELLEERLAPLCSKWVFGKEVGAQGTPHIQGAFICKKKQYAKRIQKLLGATMRLMKMSGEWQHQVYCIKDGNYITNHRWPEPIRLIDPTYEWEIRILEEIKEQPDDRSINWVWSIEGGTGKTSFCKYLAVREGAMISGGRAADCRNSIVQHLNNTGATPNLIVITIPRSFDPAYINYEGYENLKDMCFYSGKYEGGQVVGNSPHLYIFANCEPEVEKMSADRWNIINIDDDDDERKEYTL